MVERTIGPGWSAPFVIVAKANSGAMTTTQRIDALAHWQEAIAREPDVAEVLGPRRSRARSASSPNPRRAHIRAEAPRRRPAGRRGLRSDWSRKRRHRGTARRPRLSRNPREIAQRRRRTRRDRRESTGRADGQSRRWRQAARVPKRAAPTPREATYNRNGPRSYGCKRNCNRSRPRRDVRISCRRASPKRRGIGRARGRDQRSLPPARKLRHLRPRTDGRRSALADG